MFKSSNITLVVRNKDKVLFSGNAYAVSAVNDKGPFDILGQHENFITLIQDKITIHTTPTETQEIQIENGIVRVFKNKVYVYVNFKS